MKKILFVTDRNILTTSGELRLIKNRAEALYNESGIITDFLVLANKSRIENRNEVICAGGKELTYEIALSNPLITIKSLVAVRKEIDNRLKTNEYRAVVLSGPAMVLYAKRIKKEFGIPMIADIHGSFEDMVVFSKTSPILKRIMLRFSYNLEKFLLKRNTKYLEGFFVVTDALKRYIEKNYHTNENALFFVIPCAINIRPSNVGDYLMDRKKYRAKYGIEKDTVVFIYSGGVSPWQCVEKTIELYKRIADSLRRTTKLLIFSHRQDYFEALVGSDNKIQIDSYQPEELMHVLHAGDYAFLLREDSITNNVAFPNKYLEYVYSGMKIITTPYVEEIAKQVSEYNLGYLYRFDENIQKLVEYIQSNDINSYTEKEIYTVLKNNSFSETMHAFCEWYNSDNT